MSCKEKRNVPGMRQFDFLTLHHFPIITNVGPLTWNGLVGLSTRCGRKRLLHLLADMHVFITIWSWQSWHGGVCCRLFCIVVFAVRVGYNIFRHRPETFLSLALRTKLSKKEHKSKWHRQCIVELVGCGSCEWNLKFSSSTTLSIESHRTHTRTLIMNAIESKQLITVGPADN